MIIVPATVVIVGGILGYYLWSGKFPWTKSIDPSKVQMSQEKIDDVQLSCGLRMAWEDGQTRDERLFALVAGYNRSKIMQTGLCDISRKFWTLRAANHPVSRWMFRPTDAADRFSADWTEAELAQYKQLELDFKEYLRDPTEQKSKYPWLACVFAYQRTTYPGLLPWRDKRLDSTAKLVYTTASGAKYFCPS
jgi:hypothetical protein